ncbi:hypothetical protein NQ176_g32 [Zarea fungicola]|uniref:Uncharacterized protein n=1 Tax=Zarea fungicola TaxID=93591 RepID=A0ACC1NYI4_9HYPO|nr:hypothetical protein NQ176_g32 [Lecanicillium fungicola]
MTSTFTATNYKPNQQDRPTHTNLSQQQLALLQTEQASPSNNLDYLDYDNWDATQFSSQELDLALRSFISSSPMQPDNIGAVPQFTPKLGRSSHHRESSLSSLGSVGPASPFTQNISNPRIAITDPAAEPFHEMYNNDANIHNAGAYYHLAKPGDDLSGYQPLDAAAPDMAYPVAIPSHLNRHRIDRSLLPAPELGHIFNRSYPTSVASSIAGDSPSTPNIGDADHIDRNRRGMRRANPNTSEKCSQIWYAAAYGNAPKLDRTMTDIYGDELYNPSFAITSSSPGHAHGTSVSNHLFSQRLSAANSQHLNATHSPSSTASRGLSPFQATSPYAPPQLHDFASSFGAAQRMGHSGQHGQQQVTLIGSRNTGEADAETPKTISPKDAMIEFTGVDGEPNFSLFPEGSNNFDFDAYSKVIASDAETNHNELPAGQEPSNGRSYSQLPMENRIPQQYPFISRAQAIKDVTPPPRLGSSGSGVSDARTKATGNRPSRVGAESGTYTCTYHGCTLRFDTPMQLQKHKREGHRQSQNLGGLRAQDTNMASAVLNSQAGPHRCDRINPSTGKSCNTIFSRPYDLTRHEDTIHNERKHKVQCDLCTIEKTFSRADALTRHYRVCHPEAELPGKHRRRVI